MLFVIPALGGGGAYRVLVTLLQEFDRSLLDLRLAVLDTTRGTFRDEIPEDVALIDLQHPRLRRALPSVVRTIRHHRPQIVFSISSHINVALALAKGLLPQGVRLVGRETTILSLALAGESLPSARRWAYRALYPRLDRVICQSNDMYDDLVRTFGVAPEHAAVIPNPVDVERVRRLRLSPSSMSRALPEANGDALRLVASGRLVRAKGFDLLIQAVALCPELKIDLEILGDGPLRNELTHLSRSLGVQDQIKFAGFQENPFPIISGADGFVLSSRFEGFPNVVLEALACGTPVVATPAPGGVRDILEPIRECEIAASVSARDLAAALRRWAARPPERVSDSALEPYAAPVIARRYEAEILSLARS